MENLSEHLKENVTYINGLFENAMDYIEREFMVGTVPAALLTMDGLVSKQHITLSILNQRNAFVYRRKRAVRRRASRAFHRQ